MAGVQHKPTILIVARHGSTRRIVTGEVRGRYSVDYEGAAVGAGAIGIQQVHQYLSEHREPA